MLEGVGFALLEATALLFAADAEPELDEVHTRLHQMALELRRLAHEILVLAIRAKTHHPLHTGTVVPAAVKQHDLARRGQVLHIALKIPLPALELRWFLQRHHARASWIQMLHETLDGAPLACGITPFKQDHHALTRGLDPALQLEQFHLQVEFFLLVDRAAQQVLVGVAAIAPAGGQFFVGVGLADVSCSSITECTLQCFPVVW
ncbi:hypothetical protein D3C71_1476450 [compost metagenome]